MTSRDEVAEALTAERFGSQWAAREQERQIERDRLLTVMDEDEQMERESA